MHLFICFYQHTLRLVHSYRKYNLSKRVRRAVRSCLFAGLHLF